MSITLTPVHHQRRQAPVRPIGHQSEHRRRPSILPWGGDCRIATAADEERFVADLARRCDGPAPHRRSDVTAVLNALRGGLTVADLLDRAPGLRPERLISAHAALDAQRRSSVDAWNAIVASPDAATLAAHGPQAALLLPVPVERLRRVARLSPASLPDATANAATLVERAASIVRRIERALDDPDLGSEQARQLARQLFDQGAECAMAREDHLPERVGALTSTRVATLLREHESTDGESDAGAPRPPASDRHLPRRPSGAFDTGRRLPVHVP